MVQFIADAAYMASLKAETVSIEFICKSHRLGSEFQPNISGLATTTLSRAIGSRSEPGIFRVQ